MIQGHRILLFLLFCLLGINAYSRILLSVDLNDLGIYKPHSLALCQDFLFILDSSNYKIFKIGNSKVEKIFGRKGQGPGEYPHPLNIGIYNNQLWVMNLSGELIFFDLEGKYLKKTKRYTSKLQLRNLRTIVDEERYIGIKMEFTNNGSFSKQYLFVNQGKDTVLAEFKISDPKSLMNSLDLDQFSEPSVAVGKEICYVAQDKLEYCIKVFNMKTGSFKNIIQNNHYKRTKYSKEEIKQNIAEMEKALKYVPNLKKSAIKLPEYHPAIEEMYADEKDNLYVLTNEKRQGKRVMKIYDINCVQVGEASIPSDTDTELIRIKNKRMVLIRETDDSFILEIHQI